MLANIRDVGGLVGTWVEAIAVRKHVVDVDAGGAISNKEGNRGIRVFGFQLVIAERAK